jgi:hypothetical protein
VSEIHIVAVKNEVKELLFIKNQNNGSIIIKCIELQGNFSILAEFSLSDKDNEIPMMDWKNYLYEPHSTIIKADFAGKICFDYKLNAVHVDTKLYTSDERNDSFPGKVFKKLEILQPKDFKRTAQGYHIMAKNYPQSAEQIRAKYKIPDGVGNHYIILTKNKQQKPIWILAERLK